MTYETQNDEKKEKNMTSEEKVLLRKAQILKTGSVRGVK